MKLDKLKNTFNDYKVELSWGQLEAIRSALESDHADPVRDEMLAELQWYMDRVPGPGEEEEDTKAREQGQVVPTEGGEEGDFPVPMPPGEGGEVETGEGPPQPPPEEMPGGEGQPGGEGAPPGAEAELPGPEGEELPPEEGAPPAPDEADQHLPVPPEE